MIYGCYDDAPLFDIFSIESNGYLFMVLCFSAGILNILNIFLRCTKLQIHFRHHRRKLFNDGLRA